MTQTPRARLFSNNRVVKNSWGPTWGEGGYIRLARGSDQCGLTKTPVYPTVDTSTPLPAPTPPLPVPTPSPGCPSGHRCFQAGAEAQFLRAYQASSCGDRLALIGRPGRRAKLDASMSIRCPKPKHGPAGPCRVVPFDLSQPAGTSLVMRDVDISGVHRMWVKKASFVRVDFHDNAGWVGGLGGVANNGGLLTVAGFANITNCTFRRSKANKGGCLSNYVGHMHVNNTVFDSCVAAEGGAILNHGVMHVNNVTFLNNSATGHISKTVGAGAGANCVCVWQDSPGVPPPAEQCDGCTPAQNQHCHQVQGKATPGQPTYYCPGPNQE